MNELLFKRIFGLSMEDSDLLGKYENEYQQLLDDEYEEVVRYAASHGWRSTRHERSMELKNLISELNNKRIQTLNNGK